MKGRPTAETDIRVAMITGAGSGLGQLAAQRLLADGWRVAALDVDTAGLDALGESPYLRKLTVDVTDEAAIREAVAYVEEELGPISRLMHAAAIMPLGALMEVDVATTRRIMDINYGGLVNLSHAVLPRMIARGRGEYVIFGSLAGHLPIFYMGAYSASKCAVNLYAEVLHHETKHTGVQTLCVCPPAVETPLLEQGRETRWPRFLNFVPPISPESVLDAVELGLRRGQLWVFPGWHTRPGSWLRRWMPKMMWRIVRLLERPDETLAETWAETEPRPRHSEQQRQRR